MTAVERVQAAVDKLTAERDARGYFEMDGYLCETLTIVGLTLDAREEVAPVTNDELIVTLHRTIDAQLAILRLALGEARGSEFCWRFALPLANAILGADS